MNYDLSIKDYAYDLPDERIAKYPLARRDASKLLTFRGGAIGQTTFAQLPDLLPEGTLLVFNNTKVIRARMAFRRSTGASIEVFCLEPCEPADYQQAFAAQRSCTWLCTVGNLKKWKDDTLLLPFAHRGDQHVLHAHKLELRAGGEALVRFAWEADLTFGEVLEQCGVLPIPPYLHRSTEMSDYERYQTVYSRCEGSVAAPTAGLHFTQDVLQRLRSKGIDMAELTLHVGAGTFRPVKSDTIAGHEMHAEHFTVSLDTLRKIGRHIGRIVAVGTTSVRCIESLAFLAHSLRATGTLAHHVAQWAPYGTTGLAPAAELMPALVAHLDQHRMEHLDAATQILIAPPYKFNLVDGIITNFHQPQSTLLLLIAALVGNRWRDIYRYALEHEFRFLSYGDASLLWS